MMRNLVYRAALWLAVLTLHAPQAFACAVCFGDPNSPMTKAAIAGVIVLVGVTTAVLIGIAILGFTWMRRESKLAGED